MNEQDGRAIVQSPGGSNRRLGPHKVPRIECGKCGTSHHYDAAAGEYLGRCRECSAFLRRPTEEEHDQFTDFLVWNSKHLDRENDQTQLVTDGGEEVGRGTLRTDGGVHIPKTWAVVSGDEILLEEETEAELRKEMRHTDLPADHEVCALPKPYTSVFV